MTARRSVAGSVLDSLRRSVRGSVGESIRDSVRRLPQLGSLGSLGRQAVGDSVREDLS